MVGARVLHFVYPEGMKPSDKGESFKWHQTLTETSTNLRKLEDEGKARSGALNTDVFAPLAAYHETFLKAELLTINVGTLIEVELTSKDKLRPDTLEKEVKTVWIAEILHMAGYYIYGRWVGSPMSDPGFWVHAVNGLVHEVGWCESMKSMGYVLLPPDHILDYRSYQDWTDYVLKRVHHRYTLQAKYDEVKHSVYQTKYKVGDRMEIIHDDDSTCVIPAIVKRVSGRRIFFSISKEDVDKDDYFDKESLWKDQCDDLIYYVGFAAEQGYNIKANKKYKDHTKKIAKALRENTTPPYEKRDITREMLKEWRDIPECDAMWKDNMVLEILDKMDASMYGLKPARVLQVLKHGYLKIGPEGDDIEEDSFAVHSSSTMLFPVGYAAQNKIDILTPKNSENETTFTWQSFLDKTKYESAPTGLFPHIVDRNIPFKAGMRMEAVDQCEKLICPVTIKAVKGRMLHVKFDGWDDTYDQLFDYRSHELLPLGWCEMQGALLQHPQQTVPPTDEAAEPSAKKMRT